METPLRSHEVDYEIIGHDIQMVEITLDPEEAVIAEGGIQRHRAGDDARLLQLTWQKAQSIGRSE